jgi:hypothetical protein
MRTSSTPGLIDDPGFIDWSNEVFDPLSWMLDGHVGLPYDMPMQGLEDAVGLS